MAVVVHGAERADESGEVRVYLVACRRSRPTTPTVRSCRAALLRPRALARGADRDEEAEDYDESGDDARSLDLHACLPPKAVVTAVSHSSSIEVERPRYRIGKTAQIGVAPGMGRSAHAARFEAAQTRRCS